MEQEKIINIEELVQDEHNFNKGTDEGGKLMERSFKEMGAGRSVLIDKHGKIIAGNKSQKAAIAAGIKRVRVIETTGDELIAVKRTDVELESEQGRKMALLDNLTTQVNLAWDEAELQTITGEIEGFDVGDFGFDIKDMPQTEFATGKVDEPAPTPTDVKDDNFDETTEHVETRVKKGDLWQLGNHRLVCGSCTDAEAMAKLMGGERADIAFTSPPYNMMASGFDKALKSGTINVTYDIRDGAYQEYDDNLTDEDYGKLLIDALGMALTHADDALYNIGILASSKKGIVDMMTAYRDKFCDILVWNKNNCIPLGLPSNKGMVSHICELIFCFNQNGSRSFNHPQWKKGVWNGSQMTNRIDSKNAADNEYAKQHHAVFPVEFAGQVVEMYSEKSVIDQFGGTGTTMIACEQLGRKCFMTELDPHYCDIILARWEKFTGQKAQRIIREDGNVEVFTPKL